MGSTLIFQYLIDRNSKSLTLKPPQDRLIIFNEEGKAIPLKITGTNVKATTIKKADEDHLKRIADICRQGKGFCKTNTYSVLIQVSSRLYPGMAETCNDELHGLSLLLIPNNSNPPTNYSLKLEAYDPSPEVGICDNSDKGSKSPSKMWISIEDYNRLHINSMTVPRGIVSIVPQKPSKPNRGIEKEELKQPKS